MTLSTAQNLRLLVASQPCPADPQELVARGPVTRRSTSAQCPCHSAAPWQASLLLSSWPLWRGDMQPGVQVCSRWTTWQYRRTMWHILGL